MRLFCALELPENVVDALEIWWPNASALMPSDDWRSVPSSAWHLTLAFYGDVQADDADDLSEQLSECAALSPSLCLQTCGFGVFPRIARPRVFWAGVDDCSADKSLKRLARCCRRVGHATVRQRSAKETPFCAHITLARARERVRPVQAENMLKLPSVPEMHWQADSFSLFQSILRQEGPQYRRLETFKLNLNSACASTCQI